ncbi:hypothetical protein [Longimicrobium sp.]|uniref:hypothetical protein n=1 Tax=Longimicrobium sp. TaxID=2029185 RepID=UPI002E36B3F9|nr:hypothetical protein [Longimicrobium sp.]HEX6037177.1 hypothetical protein [Longimicrobium sp.]
MKQLRLSALAAALVLAAGCTASPTDTPHRDQPAPLFNGGNTTGSGNYAGGDTTGPGMLGSGNTSPQDGGEPLTSGTAGDSTSGGTQRGGNMIGSGN